MTPTHDVAIIGGGPAGTTTGTILKKYNPGLRVVIIEKEKFPREHIGESQLPAISEILNEMGCWEKVEAADFPIKIGATYRWGSSPKLWDFEFLPIDQFKDEPRPAKFEGQRRYTAFQVDRSIYDKILLDHAAEMGCEVLEEVRVDRVGVEGDRVTGLSLSNGTEITARYYVDGSGHVGTMRRALGVGIEVPTRLKNMAVWDYWDNTEWAVEIGVGGTRVQIMSTGAGWLWFIPLGPTRTSLGFVCPVEYYKSCGKNINELYDWAIEQDPRIAELIANATRDGEVRSTKDWSFVSDRICGENWYLVGEAAGFADPILAGGMTLAHTSAREAAYVILERDRGEHDLDWLHESFDGTTRRRVMQYIRFADFWYCANGQFKDLREFTTEIAADSGLNLTAEEAFRWLSLGGFTHEDIFLPGLGNLDLQSVKEITNLLTDTEDGEKKTDWEINRYNIFKLNLLGAKEDSVYACRDGRIVRVPCYRRNDRILPRVGAYLDVIESLKDSSEIEHIHAALAQRVATTEDKEVASLRITQAYATLETMLLDGWVAARLDPKKKRMKYSHVLPGVETNVHAHHDFIKTETGEQV